MSSIAVIAPVLNWTPTVTPDVGSVSGLVVREAYYNISDNKVFFTLSLDFTQNTSAANSFNVSPPVTGIAMSVNQAIGRIFATKAGGTQITSACWRFDGTNILVFDSAATWNTGAAIITIQGWYKKA